LFNLITGELAPDSGSIRLFDRDITAVPSRRRAHLGMARTYQIITLFARDTICATSRWRCSAYRNRAGTRLRCSTGSATWSTALTRRSSVSGSATSPSGPLAQTSYGERRRVEIAMALAQSPKGAAARRAVRRPVDRRAARTCSKLLARHPARRDDRDDRAQHGRSARFRRADHALHFGKVIVEGTRAEVVADPHTRRCTLVTSALA
jgi:branched-chain amino acid transport system ATP-binding protein